MKTTISSKGQIVLPVEIRKKDKLKVGQTFEIERMEEGEYLLKRVSPRPNEGLVDWLLSCPEKGFLDGVGIGGTTDDIQPEFL